MITLDDATVGMAADDKSSALNYGTIKVLAQNGTLGMAAGNHSTATNPERQYQPAIQGL